MKQEMEKYTAADLQVWSLLFNRQMENLIDKASNEYLFCLEEMKCVLNPNELPNFEKINKWFTTATGWSIHCVPGLIDVDVFFQLLAQKKFPSSTWLRPMEKLDYLEEPDMFHDIFGHVPLLANPSFSRFVHAFGQLGMQFSHDVEVQKQLQRLYWFTIEFGLIEEGARTKIFGAGIISSYHESISSISSDNIERPNFHLETVLETEFCTSQLQTKYFVIKHLDQLEKALAIYTKTMTHEMEHHC